MRILPLVSLLLLARMALAEVRIEKSVQISGQGAEELQVVNRLGSVTISGWDRAQVQVTAVKRATTRNLAEKLMVQLTRARSAPTLIRVKTYVRMWSADPERLKALLGLMRQQTRMFGSSAPFAMFRRDLQRQMAQLQLELDEMAGQAADPATSLSVPVKEGRVDLVLHIPRAIRVRARTFKHDISLTGFTSNVDLSTEEGAVLVQDGTGRVVSRTQRGAQKLVKVNGPVTVEGGDANVVLRQINGPAVRAELISGNIDARDLRSRKVDLRSVLGDIRIGGRFPDDAELSLISRDGSLRVIMGQRSSFRLRGQAPHWSLGQVNGLIRRERGVVEGSVGSGGALLKLITYRGRVELE